MAAKTPPEPLPFLEKLLVVLFDFAPLVLVVVLVIHALVDVFGGGLDFLPPFVLFCLLFVDHDALQAFTRNSNDSSSSNQPRLLAFWTL
jgi:hypothetical protein